MITTNVLGQPKIIYHAEGALHNNAPIEASWFEYLLSSKCLIRKALYGHQDAGTMRRFWAIRVAML